MTERPDPKTSFESVLQPRTDVEQALNSVLHSAHNPEVLATCRNERAAPKRDYLRSSQQFHQIPDRQGDRKRSISLRPRTSTTRRTRPTSRRAHTAAPTQNCRRQAGTPDPLFALLPVSFPHLGRSRHPLVRGAESPHPSPAGAGAAAGPIAPAGAARRHFGRSAPRPGTGPARQCPAAGTRRAPPLRRGPTHLGRPRSAPAPYLRAAHPRPPPGPARRSLRTCPGEAPAGRRGRRKG